MAQLTQSDLVYQGAFKLPAGTFGASTFPNGGNALAFNPAGDNGNGSLFIASNINQACVGEIAIPQPVVGASLSELNTATVLQNFVEPTEGARSSILWPGSRLGGMLVNDGKLLLTMFVYYDATFSQTLSHFRRPLNLSTTGQVEGPYRVTDAVNHNSGFFSSYMCDVPEAHQAAIGKPCLTGNCVIPIISRTSWGPAAFGFDPSRLGVDTPVIATPLVWYDATHPLVNAHNVQSIYFNASGWIRGLAFPEGFDSLLFFGHQGIGPYCYGGLECNDPTSGNQGVHAYPYRTQIWHYSITALLAADNPYDVVPDIWPIDLPFQLENQYLGGVAEDRVNNLIYVVGNGEFSTCNVHVFAVQGAPVSEPATITRSLATVHAGNSNTVTWADIPTPAVGDLVGLFTAGLGNNNPVEWFYLNNTKVAPGSPVGASGNFAFTIPRHMRGGTYEFRLLTTDETSSNTLLATSESFTVQGRKVRIKL